MIFNKHKKLTARLLKLFLSHEFKGGYILNIQKDENHMILQLQLPPAREVSDLENLLDNLKQETGYQEAKITEIVNKRLTIVFGNFPDEILFDKSYLTPGTLQIKLPTAFGYETIDFEDGASCHMLNGGAPRMGKTLFLLYLASVLYHQNPDKIHLYITSVKGKDFYPLFGLSNTQVSDENEDDVNFLQTLTHLQSIYKERNTLLYSPALEKATDSKSVKKLYPHMYHHFYPIFLIIDEYARFSDSPLSRQIHKLVAELVQTAGYVNVHVIVSTQRPDARQTLPANIKMGLMCRICFRTSDENNSIVILDEKGAESLPKKEGRSILKDGEKSIVQVPLLSYEKCEELLKPYKREKKPNEQENPARSENNQIAHKVSDLFKESDSSDTF